MISSHNFDCGDVKELLDDFRRNEIEPHLRVLISEHLESCDACATELRTREAIAEAMRNALPPVDIPNHLPSNVRRAIASQRTPQSANRRNAQLLPLMLAAAVVVTAGIAMLQMQSTTPIKPHTEIAVAPESPQRNQQAMPAASEPKLFIPSESAGSAAPAPPQPAKAARAVRQVAPAAPMTPVPAYAPMSFADKVTTLTDAAASETTTTTQAITTRASITTSPRAADISTTFPASPSPQ